VIVFAVPSAPRSRLGRANAALRLQWADTGYRLSVSAQDREAAADYERRLGTNAGEIIAAGASLALREPATVVDLSAAAVWRWEHPSANDDEEEMDLRKIRVRDVNERALSQWTLSAKGDNGLNVMRTRRDRLTHRTPRRGVYGQIGTAKPLRPVTLDDVHVNEMARRPSASRRAGTSSSSTWSGSSVELGLVDGCGCRCGTASRSHASQAP
jgi:hypothetical protein